MAIAQAQLGGYGGHKAMNRILKMFLSISLIALCAVPVALGQSERFVTAEYAAQSLACQATSGSSVLLDVYYNDGSSTLATDAQVGVSGCTTTLTLNLYEAGAVVTTAARFGNRFNGAIEIPNEQLTIQDIVSAINNDTSGYWHAKVGRDAYPTMPAAYLVDRNVVDANVPSGTPVELKVNPDRMGGISVGVDAEEDARIRLKKVSESTGTSTGNVCHWIDFYDGGTCVYTYTCTQANTAVVSSTIYDTSTNTVDFTEGGGKGLGTTPGNKLTVVVRYPTSATLSMGGETDRASGNVSILYDVWQGGL